MSATESGGYQKVREQVAGRVEGADADRVRRQLEVLYRLSTDAASAGDLQSIYSAAIDAVIEGLNADRASLLLFNRDGVLRFKASQGLSSEYKRAVEGHSPWTVETHDAQPILVPHVEEDESLQSLLPVLQKEGISALAFVPLRHEGRLMGKFMAYFNEPHPFPVDEVRLAEMIANHVAMAISRRRAEDEREVLFSQREAERAQLETIIMHMPVGVAIVPGGRLDLAIKNARAEELWPHVHSALTGADSVITRVIDEGKMIIDFDVPYEADSGASGFISLSASPVHVEDGSVSSAIVILEDVSARKQSETTLRFIADTTLALAESLDYQSTLQKVAELVVPSFADWCDFDLLNDEGELELVSLAHTRPDFVMKAREIRQKYPPAPAMAPGIMNVVETKQTMLVPEVTDEMIVTVARNEEHLDALRSFGFRSVVVTPLVARGKVIGTMSLMTAESGRRYSESDIPYVEELAQSCALAIDNARLYADATREVRERQRAEAALRDSEERYRMLSEATTDYIFSYRRADDGRFELEWISDAFERITGWSKEDIMDRSAWGPAIHPDDVELVTSFSNRLRQGERAVQEHRMLRKDGSIAWLRIYGRPMFDEETGEVTGILGAGQDISARKSAEQALHELAESLERRIEDRTRDLATANERLLNEVEERSRAEDRLARANHALRTSNRELQDFAYVASHDLQEPLRKIQSFADLLRSDYGPRLDDQGKFYIQRMQSAASRMSDLIKGLLGYSRVRTQGLPFQTVDLREVVRDVLSDLEITISENRAAVSTQGLPTIEADPIQMRQLFQNLIGNALKFRDPSRPPIVRIKATEDESQCVIEVSDNGIGFGPQYAERIFGPFQRLHGRAAYPGTGMGLAICRRIVERHGGTITATGALSEGATFTITLPLKQETWASELADTAVDA